MAKLIAKAGAAALIALTALTATVSTASASGWDRGGSSFTIQIGGGHFDRNDRHGRHDRDRRHGPRHKRQYLACAPGHAIQKARWHGLRRAQIERFSHRRIVVSGSRHHRYDRMVFANAPGCPLIRR